MLGAIRRQIFEKDRSFYLQHCAIFVRHVTISDKHYVVCYQFDNLPVVRFLKF